MQNRKSLVQIASQCQGFAILQPFRNAQSTLTGILRFCVLGHEDLVFLTELFVVHGK